MSNINNNNNQGEIILQAINRKLNDYIFGNPIPCIVKKYNAENDTADIQLAVKLFDNEGDFLEYGTIYEIPIMRYSSKTANFKIKIKEGDEGLFICSSRGLGDWFEKTASTGKIENEDNRSRWGLQNAFFFPSFFKNKTAEVNILKNINESMVEIKSAIQNIITTIDNLSSAMVQVGAEGQPAPFTATTIANLTNNKTQLTLNKNNLTTLIQEGQKTYDN
jgi:hypothetical protein